MAVKRKPINVVGERKMARARAVVRPGKGVIKINGSPLETLDNKMLKLMIEEPVIIAGDMAKQLDMDINVKGGGIVGRAEAIRQAITLGILGFNKKKEVKELFENYDRNMIVADPRRTEPHKPSRSSSGPRRHKQRSKR